MRLINTLSRYFHPGNSVSFWHTPIAPVFYDFASLGDYYIDFSAKTNYEGPRDIEGIILLDYKGKIGMQYNPCAVSQLALGHFKRWREGAPEHREEFLKLARWLRDSQKDGKWEYVFDLDAYGVKAPWTSALAQGQGISVLVRAELECEGEGYREAAAAACEHMLTPVSRGGLLREENGNVYLEEIVSDRLTGILDGMIFSVFGLQDYIFATADAEAGKTLDQCIDTLSKILPLYDMGFWSRADLYSEDPKMIASYFYHGLHISQLKVLVALTGLEVFGNYAERWEKAAESPLNRARAFAQKVWFKLAYY